MPSDCQNFEVDCLKNNNQNLWYFISFPLKMFIMLQFHKIYKKNDDLEHLH